MTDPYPNDGKRFLTKERILFTAGAVAINMILFALIPNLVAKGIFQKSDENIKAVNIVKLREPEPEPEPEKPPEPEKKPDPVKKPELIKPRMEKLTLDLPEISFDINPRLEKTMPVVSVDRPFTEGELDAVPVPTYKSAPVYPYRAKRLKLSGQVKISFIVDENGLVKDIRILEAEPPGIFEKSVLKAVSSWRYSPGELTGEKVATLVKTTIIFNMEN